MRYFLALMFLAIGVAAHAQEWEDRQIFGGANAPTTLRVISSTDTDLFAPLIEAFVGRNPTIAVEYLVTDTADIDRRVRETPERFDIAISSAMDLQLKLTNDGYALPLQSISHPSWAEWRQSLFAFTSEPATIVVNRTAFGDLPIPRSRQELIEVLRARPEAFQGKVGTYDVRQSGLGYLFATQDARASETFWRLMEVMGRLDVQLYCCSGDMIDDLASGRIAVAYNVLGSYAEARVQPGAPVEIIRPTDFLTTMMRTAFVSRTAQQPDAAETFIRALVAFQTAANPNVRSLPGLNANATGAEQGAIPLEPALMTFLDSMKRNKFIAEWEDALIQN